MRRRTVLLAAASAAAGIVLPGDERTDPPAGWQPTLLTSAAWRRDVVLDCVPDCAAGSAAATAARTVPASDWLTSGTRPGAGTRWQDMVDCGLVDIKLLMGADGALSAGAAPGWSYCWPRDTAFAVAAMSRTGHRAEAVQMLRFLQRVQRPDGGFAARVRPTGGVPDLRVPQADAAGWTLWAVDRVAADVPAADEAARLLAQLRGLVDGCVGNIARQLRLGRRGLPAAASDYWERREADVPLSVPAVDVIGLRCAARVLRLLADAGGASRCDAAAQGLEAALHEEFGPGGYQRYRRRGGPDAGVCLLLPPFTASASPAVVRAWEAYQRRAARPGGGLAPGAGWRRDGISWTPEVALVAYTAAASGRSDVTGHWLDWLDGHRVPWGSLPEKVCADGSPAGPAPLAWTAASVTLAVGLAVGAAVGPAARPVTRPTAGPASARAAASAVKGVSGRPV